MKYEKWSVCPSCKLEQPLDAAGAFMAHVAPNDEPGSLPPCRGAGLRPAALQPCPNCGSGAIVASGGGYFCSGCGWKSFSLRRPRRRASIGQATR